ncbi:hypothetical protein [Metabacillus arenae]|uniref:Uncharacterized protein n=1 Tax=Metabacillus arenae TaxID=2771434 RepID=A0A926NNJ6_9BACI|nr:hypothetical protein [Metabacillus arenae]MBD1381081.1 hypothetical protein [Metabacillus arenae]
MAASSQTSTFLEMKVVHIGGIEQLVLIQKVDYSDHVLLFVLHESVNNNLPAFSNKAERSIFLKNCP